MLDLCVLTFKFRAQLGITSLIIEIFLAIAFLWCIFFLTDGLTEVQKPDEHLFKNGLRFREGYAFYKLLSDLEECQGLHQRLWSIKPEMSEPHEMVPLWTEAVEKSLWGQANRLKDLQQIPWRKKEAENARTKLAERLELYLKILPIQKEIGYYFESTPPSLRK